MRRSRCCPSAVAAQMPLRATRSPPVASRMSQLSWWKALLAIRFPFVASHSSLVSVFESRLCRRLSQHASRSSPSTRRTLHLASPPFGSLAAGLNFHAQGLSEAKSQITNHSDLNHNPNHKCKSHILNGNNRKSKPNHRWGIQITRFEITNHKSQANRTHAHTHTHMRAHTHTHTHARTRTHTKLTTVSRLQRGSSKKKCWANVTWRNILRQVTSARQNFDFRATPF